MSNVGRKFKRLKNRSNQGERSAGSPVSEAAVADRKHLLAHNLHLALEAWNAAQGRVNDPVVFILDLNDKLASQVALGAGMSFAEVQAQREALRGFAIAVAVIAIERGFAVEFTRLSSPQTQISQHLAQGAAPGCVDIVVVASRGNLFVRHLPETVGDDA